MPPLTEAGFAGEFLLSEAPGTLSREGVTIDASQTLKNGQVLGRITRGAQSVIAAAMAGNTGNGTVGSLTGDAGIPDGVYTVVLVEPATNAGAFLVYKPDGSLDTPGRGTVGVAYNGAVNFTLADGATDFVSGDGFTITVSYAAGSGRCVAHNLAGTDGSEVPYGVLYQAVTTGAAETAKATAIVRNAEVISARLAWGAHSAPQKAAALATLALANLIAR